MFKARLEALSTTAEAILTLAQRQHINGIDRPLSVLVHNVDAAIDVYIGDSTVTNAGANGEVIAAGERLSFDLIYPDDDPYLVAASGTPNVRIVLQGAKL